VNDDLVAMLERERLTRPRHTSTPKRVKNLTAEADRYLLLQEAETATSRRRRDSHLRSVA
jgi:hypothetical protein